MDQAQREAAIRSIDMLVSDIRTLKKRKDELKTNLKNNSLFLIVYPNASWLTKEDILDAHSMAISRGDCPIDSRTEDVYEAMASLDDAGLYAFEKD